MEQGLCDSQARKDALLKGVNGSFLSVNVDVKLQQADRGELFIRLLNDIIKNCFFKAARVIRRLSKG
ncbi:hypothetical protein Dalk_1303 [Desulfatibacillum aliphaticivorans]|uniref:Uncharacterized protein n=1 Tax=Desulfatibacillum aliphaticivorans TaxID=218208 RepID=B8F9R0_DESAL|nr:hypothetical protein Dalk_1303 [Desulfatibacillum aliphaticivorans]